LSKTLIILVTYNGAKWLPEVLDALGVSDAYDVWARDNGSKDDTLNLLQNHPAAAFVSAGENVGFGVANNMGMQFALDQGYDSVFLLNQDCRIDAQSMLELRKEGLRHHSHVSCPVQMNWSREGPNLGFDTRYAPGWQTASGPFDVDFVNAAAWFIPVKVLRDVGGFNPGFFMYGEDRDWARRLLKVGGRFTVLPSIECFHQSSAQAQKMDKRAMNERIVFSFEVTAYFVEADSHAAWKRGWLGRAVRRSFHRKQLFNTLTLVNPLAEWRVRKRIQSSREEWEVLREGANRATPFLGSPTVQR
jgi:GT2 family glycosyltransferase